MISTAFIPDQPGNAARSIAAGAGLAAVGIEKPDRRIGAGSGCWADHNQLIAADAGIAVGERAGDGGIDRERFATRIEHDKIVAEPVHLAEADPTHVPAYMAGGLALSNKEPGLTGGPVGISGAAGSVPGAAFVGLGRPFL